MKPITLITVLFALTLAGCSNAPRSQAEFERNHPYAEQYRLIEHKDGSRHVAYIDEVPVIYGTFTPGYNHYTVDTYNFTFTIKPDGTVTNYVREVYFGDIPAAVK